MTAEQQKKLKNGVPGSIFGAGNRRLTEGLIQLCVLILFLAISAAFLLHNSLWTPQMTRSGPLNPRPPPNKKRPVFAASVCHAHIADTFGSVQAPRAPLSCSRPSPVPAQGACGCCASPATSETQLFSEKNRAVFVCSAKSSIRVQSTGILCASQYTSSQCEVNPPNRAHLSQALYMPTFPL